MNLIDLSIRRPVFAWILMFGLIVFGAISLNRTGISQMPDVDFPVLSISVSYEGAAPEVVEAEIIDPIEEKLLLIEGIEEMRASASQGSGRVTLYFNINRNVDVALQEVQSALSQLRLPTDVDPPIIRKQNPEEDPILILSIYGDASMKELLKWTDGYLLDQLRFLPGVGEVSIQGFSERNLRVWIDPKKLEALDLSINDVTNALKTQHIESAAGQLIEGERELRLRWLGEAANPEEVGNIRILTRSGGGAITFNRMIRVKDVARVDDGLSDIRRMARVDGKEAISISIRKQRGTNEIDVAKAVRERIEEIKDQFPKGYHYRFNVDFTKSTEATVNLTIEKLWVAALITILVCFLFLGSVTAAVNILFSIPVSIVGTFTILYFSGFTLNLFTLLALTLAISIVVDDAIMLLENIVRHSRMGKSANKAASDGSKEVLPAAVAATLAVIAVFLPVIFMDGIIGKFFFQFGVTMSAAVLLSLLEAVTITPMRSAAFLATSPKESKFELFLEHLFEKLAHGYQAMLKVTLKWKYLVVISSLVFFAVSLLLVSKVRQEFVPAQDQNIIMVNAQTPPGSSLEYTSEVAKKLEEIVKANENVAGFFVSVGGGGGASSVNQAFMPIELKPKETRKLNHTQVMSQLRESFKQVKGVRITMRDISARNLTSGRTNPIAVNLRGPDLQVLNDSADKLMEALEKGGFGVDLDKDYRAGIPELLVLPDRVKMEKQGVSIESVGQILSVGVGGYRQGRFTQEGRRYDIRFKIPEGLVKSAADIKKLKVRNVAGNLIPLSDLVKVVEKKTSQSINRINRQRSVTVYGNLAPEQSQSVVIKKVESLAKEILPKSYVFALEGASAGFAESFKSLMTALLVGILVAYMILAVQFNSFIHPIPVLIALPFSVTGALIALWGFDVSLNLFSFIGLIVLMGIAKKNSILLVEFTNQTRLHHGKDVLPALIEACPVRLRPILMTSVATVAAATPLIFGHGMGSETRLPMGLAIVGGTIVSTILTLFVVPALYLVLSKLESKHGIKEREIV
ncbi:efflux RND transporter permease subunit [Bdellovibrio sp. HCB2-146]|uniref:efflux RND transporter permease subunit n=1 Tax=Bdellovibrio sp. HCB2-146 TaxID=3394362 RepID=UPI0039BD68B8